MKRTDLPSVIRGASVPPLPPLGDSAVARVERGIFAALDRLPDAAAYRQPTRWRYGFALAAIAAVAGFALIGMRELRRRSDATARGTRIATATSGSHVTIPGASVDVAPSSAISFGAARDGAVAIVLERGAVTCEVAPRSHRAPFIVEAGATRVTVIGTLFTVERLGTHARVSVEHGVVEVGDGGMTQVVHAGERYQPGSIDGQGEVSPITTTSVATARPSFGGPLPGMTRPASLAAPTAASAPAATVTATDGDRSVASVARAAPLARFAPATRPRPRRAPLTLSFAENAPSSRTAPVSARPAPILPATSSPEPSVRSNPALPQPQPQPRMDDGQARPAPLAAAPLVEQRFQSAARLELRDPAAALGIYAELESGTDAWAANALFARGRLEAELGHAARARQLLEIYLQRFPHGHNVPDAHALLSGLR